MRSAGEPGDPEDELRALLDDEVRDTSPGASRVVALAAEDAPALRALIERRALRVVRLERRGVDHGEWAELEPGPTDSPRAAWRERFARADPIVLPGLVPPAALAAHAPLLEARMRLLDELRRPGGLLAFARAAAPALAPEFRVVGPIQAPARSPAPPGSERDLERVAVHRARDGGRPPLTDLWLKTARLSTYPGDRSLRLRCSFGREVEDDASRDVVRHAAVTELAERLLPECRLAHDCEPLRRLLDEWVGERVGAETFLTQHIAYWNAPGGGARFHHDAFDEPEEGGQRGVVYLQLTGTSAWLALSLADLGARVTELAARLAAGDAPWLREALFPAPAAFRRFQGLVASPARLRAELALPGCGALAPVVDRGPEVTGLLADSGHAYLLDPGDAIVLPNHGLGSTCMHSVLCASDEAGYALSMAVRSRGPGSVS